MGLVTREVFRMVFSFQAFRSVCLTQTAELWELHRVLCLHQVSFPQPISGSVHIPQDVTKISFV